MSLRSWKPQVYLVGAGPGDPGLLTRRGEQCLRRADLVLYDNLTNPEILRLARPEAERRYVGKKAGGERADQAEINALMIRAAAEGRVVVRLKGGDSFVFGRGGEEAEALSDAGIPFEVVPGVTSAVAVPALAGIPVTQRGINTILHVFTGHEDPDDPKCGVPWDLLGRGGGTIVILMGQTNIAKILSRLLAAGLPASTPLATIRRGSYPDQKSVRMTLGEAAARADSAWMSPPAITVVGGVAGMDAALNVFERRPLFGRRIVLTRPEESGTEILDELREAGADCVNVPVVRIEPEAGISDRLRTEIEALRAAGGWIVLPSPTAAGHFFRALDTSGLDARALGGVRVAAVGSASARAIHTFGVRADFVPEDSTGASLAASLPLGSGAMGVLVAGSSSSRPELREGLAARGARVAHLPLYSTLADAAGAGDVLARAASGACDAVVVFSPSAARAVADAAVGEMGHALARRVWFAIGPTTRDSMERLGFGIAGVATEPTGEALIDALAGTPRA